MNNGAEENSGFDMVIRTALAFRNDQNPDHEEHTDDLREHLTKDQVVGDLSHDFERHLRYAIYSTQNSLNQVELELQALSAGQGAGVGVGVVSGFTSLFRMGQQHSTTRKLQHLHEVRVITNLLDQVASAFPGEYDLYRTSVNALNSALERDPRYSFFQSSVSDVALAKGLKREAVKAMMSDPFIQTHEIIELRRQAQEIVSDPAVNQLFKDVENRFMTIDRMLSDVTAGTSKLGTEKGLDLSAFRPLADVADRMSVAIDQPHMSRPGGPVMDGPNNSISEHFQKLAKNIRHIIDTIVENVRAAFSSASPSSSL